MVVQLLDDFKISGVNGTRIFNAKNVPRGSFLSFQFWSTLREKWEIVSVHSSPSVECRKLTKSFHRAEQRTGDRALNSTLCVHLLSACRQRRILWIPWGLPCCNVRLPDYMCVCSPWTCRPCFQSKCSLCWSGNFCFLSPRPSDDIFHLNCCHHQTFAWCLRCSAIIY